jgi:transcription-repair coupling factor (superfamily II helicase)
VGRSSAQAYAYLLTAEFSRVDEQSLRRLRALEQYTELGSGFQIAMRDLEIRGAGNILGTRQHGFIAAVGFELYCRLLQEAVAEIKGEKPAAAKSDVRVDVPVEAVIPTEYVPDGAARISLYQELSAIDAPQGIAEMRRELADRFGPLPSSVQSLLLLMEIKTLARRIGCSHVKVAGGMLMLGFEGDAAKVQERVSALITSSERTFEVAYETPIMLTTGLAADDRAGWAQETRDILERCSAS